MLRPSFVLLALVGLVTAARADRYDATLDLLGYGARPTDEVVEAVVLSESPRLAERLLGRIPDVHPWTAARDGDLARLELALLANVRRLSMPSPDRTTSILAAAVEGPEGKRGPVVGLLLERELDSRNEKPQLDRAIRDGKLDVVEAYCNVDRMQPLLATALHDACWLKRTAIAKRIIAADVDVTEARTWGFQAIHAAMFRRENELVELLIDKGAVVDVFIAAGLGRLAQMSELLESGVPEEFRNSVGPHPAFFAARTGQMATLEPFLGDRSVVRRTGHRGFNLLIAAAETAPAEVVERLLKAGVDRNQKAELFDDKQADALHFAASTGNVPAARALLAAGFEVDTATERGATPLHLAAEYGQREMARLLIENGATVDAERNGTESPLYLAAARGRPSMATLLLDAGANVNGVGKSPLRIALANGRVVAAKRLLERGSNELASASQDIAPERVPTTPLGIVASGRSPELVTVFLDLGQDADRVQGNPEAVATPVLTALASLRGENALRLLRAGGGVRPKQHGKALYFAGRLGRVDVLEALLATGIDLDAPVSAITRPPGPPRALPPGVRPTTRPTRPTGVRSVARTGLAELLRGAIESNRADVVRYLSSVGADLEVQMGPVDAPLGFAAEHDSREVLHALLEGGADPNRSPYAAGREPVVLAMNSGSVEAVRLLVEHGAKPTFRGGVHLVTAAGQGDVDHVARLLALGYGIDGPHEAGEPLVAAAESGRRGVVELLLERGANPRLADPRGRTVAHAIAARSGPDVRKLLELLAESGAALDRRDNEGVSPLHLAVANGNEQAIAFLLLREPALDLHLAAALGNGDFVERELKRDPAALLESRPPLGSPLSWAAKGGQAVIVRRLIAAGGATPAFYDSMPEAVATGDAKLVAFLAEHGVSVNGSVKQYGEPLRIAIQSRDPALVAALLDHRANPNASPHDWTPLQCAATRGLPEIAQLLLDAGAHVNGIGFGKRSALDLALDSRSYASGRFGENTRNTRGTPEGKLAVARVLLDAGARARVGTPGKLCYAANVGEPELIERLLATGGDPNEVYDSRRTTPLLSALDGRRAIKETDDDVREARKRAFETVIDRLLAAGADPTQAGPDSRTPQAEVLRAGSEDLRKRFARAVERLDDME